MQSQKFIVNGMHCNSCAKLTAKRIKNIDSVTDAVVDLQSKIASVEAQRKITSSEINTELADSNYRVEEA